jgi:Zn-dependent peptidase ImmA (M78 family)
VDILTKYNDGALLVAPQAMDVDHFAEFHCDATIDFANLSQDGETLGCSCFNDGVLLVWDDTRTKEIKLNVLKGYIFVDKALLDSEVEGRIRFTIIHECSHLILHPRFYYQKPGSTIPTIDCKIYHVDEWTKRSPMTDEEIREWQANRLGAALIMPVRTVKILLAEKLGITTDALCPNYLSGVCIQDMADVFKVSKTAMYNRLRDLDLLLQ